MNFSTDRDLLALEPNVFTDVPFLSQQRLRVNDGVVVGTSLTSAAADFAAAGLEGGQVVLIAGVPHEVSSRVNTHTLSVSQLRARLHDAAVPPVAGTGLELVVRTFAPQAALVHDLLLRLVGIEPDDPAQRLTEDAIVSLSVMARLEALGTLERVYTAAVNIVENNDNLWKKALTYRERFTAGCQRALVLIDADGDGYADLRRQPGVMHLVRV